MKPTQNVIKAAQAVVEATAQAQVTKQIVEAYQQEILNANDFTWDAEEIAEGATGFVKSVKDTYMMSRESFAQYDQLCYAAALKAGFEVAAGYCPKLMAESAQLAAELALVEAIAAEQNLPVLVKATPNKRKEIIDLTLKYVGPYLKK